MIVTNDFYNVHSVESNVIFIYVSKVLNSAYGAFMRKVLRILSEQAIQSQTLDFVLHPKMVEEAHFMLLCIVCECENGRKINANA